MQNKRWNRYYLLVCLGVLFVSCYPLSMGVRVIADMITDRMVLKENYPKYIIPYTPICVALLTGVLILPLCMKLCKRFSLLGGSAVSVGVFFALEMFFENQVVVTSSEITVSLEDWQMDMCVVRPEGWVESVKIVESPVDILTGNYDPAFKLHFYIISVVLLLSMLNCIYGFAQIIKTGEKTRLKALILQAVASLAFLGLCILACFTAFWRDGTIQVSPLSAKLMILFFALFGITVGIYAGSFLLGRRKLVSVGIPAIAASVMTTLMYVGEMILLHGQLYRFGTGIFFAGISGIVLAPVDLLVIVLSGCVTAFLFLLLNRKKERNT